MGTTSVMTPPGTAHSPTGSGGLKAQMVWHAVRRHPIVVLLVVLFAGAVATGAWLFLPLGKRTGVAVFYIAPQSSLVSQPGDSKAESQSYRTMQAALVKQRLVLMDALKKSGAKDFQLFKGEPDHLAVLEQKLKVDFKLGPEFMRVSIEGDVEEELLQLLGELSQAYLAQVTSKEAEARTYRQKKLEDLRKKYEQQIAGLQKKMSETPRAWAFQVHPAALAVIDDVTKSRLEQLRQDMVRNERELQQAQRNAKSYAEQAGKIQDLKVPDADVERALQKDDGVISRQKAIVQTRLDFEERDRQLRDKSHPALAAAKKAWEAAQTDLEFYRTDQRQKIADAIRQAARQDHAQKVAQNAARILELGREKDDLEKALGLVEREVAVNGRTYGDVEKTRQEIARNEKWYDQVVHDLDQLELEKAVPPRVSVSEEPYVLSGLEGNRRLKAALMAAAGSLVVALGGLVFWESRNRRVLAVDDVGKGLGLKVFGTVPVLTPDREPSPGREAALTEAIDTARTMLLYGAHGGRPPKSVLVTSALPAEGKTSVTGHLAISLTRAGYRTLLIDADLRNPSGHRIFGLPDGPGLCECLRGEADLEAAVRPAPFPGLSVLPAGRWSLAATQALAGDRWAALRAAVEAEYDFVVIDSAPVLPVVDSLLLARHVDGVLLSVLREQTTVASVAETQYRLLSTGANVLGVVVNGIEPKGGRYGYVYRPSVPDIGPAVATTA